MANRDTLSGFCGGRSCLFLDNVLRHVSCRFRCGKAYLQRQRPTRARWRLLFCKQYLLWHYRLGGFRRDPASYPAHLWNHCNLWFAYHAPPELMSGPWDSSRVAQMALCQVRLIILTSHELLQQKQHSKQVSTLTYEPCTVSCSHPWRTESGHTQARTWNV